MGETTGIQWTDHTFNPWWGCEKVSPACDHCYAESLAKRYGHGVWGHDAPRRFFGEKHWQEPVKWNRAAVAAGERRRVFCASMADVFEHHADIITAGKMAETRWLLWHLIEATPMLDWQLLTKRPSNVRSMLGRWMKNGFPPNVWIGTTAEDQHWLDVRARYLEDIPAAVKFLSYEPALGPLPKLAFYTCNDGRNAARFNWVIAGGESGSGCRPMDQAWVRDVRDQCLATGTPFFFKQWGGFHPKANGATLDGREWKQFPSVLNEPNDVAGTVAAVAGSVD